MDCDAHTGREYAAADSRWGTADPTIVSLELLTVFVAGPLAVLIVYQIVKRDPARHYWIVVLSTAELYGGYVFLLLFIFGGEQENCVKKFRMPDMMMAGGGDRKR